MELDVYMDGTIEQIQADIEQLDKVALHLKTIQAKLRRQVNEIQSAPGKLPDEILGTILSYVCMNPSKYSNKRWQIVLGGVSFRWRQIIWSNPKLWKVLVMKVSSEEPDRAVALLSLYVRNVGSCPLELEFDLWYVLSSLLQEPEESLAWLTTLKDLVFRDAATKIKALNARFIPARWFTLFSGNFPNLQKLTMEKLEWPEQVFGTSKSPSGVAEVTITGVPNLHHLVYVDFDPRIIFPWHQITILDMRRLPMPQIFHLLHLCPNVSKVSIYDFLAGSNNEFDWKSALERRPIKLDRLVSLQVTQLQRTCGVIRRLHFPVLSKLHWFGAGYRYSVTDALDIGKTFRSLRTVTCLAVDMRHEGVSVPDIGWKEIFPNLTRLELLRLVLVPQTFLKTLDPRSELNSESEQLVLPRLEHLVMEMQAHTENSAKQLRRLLVDLVTMLKNRRQVSPEFRELTLIVSEEIEELNGRKVRKQLRKLVKGGLKLTILVGARDGLCL